MNIRAPYVPEQNDEAGRLNKTLLYKVRFMLNGRKIPRSMWGEMLKTAAYLMNRSPSHASGEMTPFEKVN